MLTFMRRNAGSWLIKLLLIGVALSFLIGFGPSSIRKIANRNRNAGMTADTVAKVGDIMIGRTEFLDQVEQVKRNYQQMGMGQNSEIFNTPFFLKSILSGLIESTILSLTAQDMGISASDADVAEYIKRQGNFVEKGKFSRDRMMNYLRRSEMSLSDYENSIRFKIAGAKLAQLLQNSVFASDDELWQAYRKDYEKINLDVIRLTKDMTAVDPAELKDDELKAAFDKSPEDYRIPEKRKLDYFYLSLKDFITKAEVSDGDVDSYYKTHSDEFSLPESVRLSQIVLQKKDAADIDALKKKADKIREQAAVKTADFAALAKKNSQDEITAKKGGDIGWKTMEGGDKLVMEKVVNLAVGDVSEVIETPAEFKIVKVMERKPAGVTPFDEVKTQIRLNLQTSKAHDLLDAEINKIYGELKPQTDLRDYAQQMKLEILSTPYFTKNEPVPGIEKGEKLAADVFVMTPKEISKPHEGLTRYYIYQLAEVKESVIPAFEEAKDAVRLKLAAAKSMDKLKEKSAALLADLTVGKITMAQAAAEMKTEVISTGDFNSKSYSVPKVGALKGFSEAAFAVPDGVQFPKECFETSDTSILFRVAARAVPTKTEFEDTKIRFEKKYLEEKGRDYLTRWVEAKKALYPTIENQEFWAKFTQSSETN